MAMNRPSASQVDSYTYPFLLDHAPARAALGSCTFLICGDKTDDALLARIHTLGPELAPRRHRARVR
jgi:hypothetical protein